MHDLALVILGVAIGLALYKIFIELLIGTINPSICDFCKYKKEKGHLRKGNP